MQKPDEKQGADNDVNAGERINDFIQKNRRPIFIMGAALLALLIAVIAAFSLMDVFRNRAIAAVEDFSGRYETMLPSAAEEYAADDVAAFIEELTSFAQKNSGYPGGRALLLIGGIHSAKKEWAEAEAAYAAAAKSAAKTYLAPLAWFNAAAAAEEQGKTTEAIEYYTGSLATPAVFPAAPRAQFSIGRLHESLNEDAKAVEAYRAVISGWPNDQIWPNLARSRIITLETKTDGGLLQKDSGEAIIEK
ncbi:MAG: tetratricopeptide repeat protein [Treponema sp.]|jgi:tetratricopeptide (TPR) repeat protein|nr:tetratricopeptide repeat protein [Treponema sp.]